MDEPKDSIDPEDEGGEAPCWAHLVVEGDDPALRHDTSPEAEPEEPPQEVPGRRPAAPDATS